ncbi:hypothetical protein NB696_002069 [Xanthomonas sacchari]|nr:hypothetical protein [Xanthomonas sacchari]
MGNGVAAQRQLRGAQAHAGLLRAEHALLAQRAGRAQVDVVAGHRGAGQAQLAGAVDLQAAALRGQGAAADHADTGFGGDQADAVGVHAAQVRHVDTDRRRCAVAARQHLQQHAVVADTLRTGAGQQILSPHRTAHAQLPRQQIQAVHVVRVQTVAADAQRTAGDGKPVQGAVGAEQRGAGGQGDARGVEEAAAVADDAVGIGDHQLRLGPGDLGIALQAAGGGGDFVEDQRGRAAVLQVVVAGDVAAQFGLGDLRAVVEDQPVAADVEARIAVVRDAARVGGDDVDHRHAVGGGLLAGLAPVRIGDRCDLRVQRQRGPGDGAAQQRGQAALERLEQAVAAVVGTVHVHRRLSRAAHRGKTHRVACRRPAAGRVRTGRSGARRRPAARCGSRVAHAGPSRRSHPS